MRTSSIHNTFAAFLRGINVGGNNPIKMDTLRKALENIGLHNVRTILASGNIVFDTTLAIESNIAGKIERCLQDTLEKEIGVIVRSIDHLQTIVESDPFQKVPADSKTKFYVTFLSDNVSQKSPSPNPSRDSGFCIVRSSKSEVFSYVVLTKDVRSTDFITWLDKNYGKLITTRTWGTIKKVLNAAHKEATK